ncbi:hypothetical protein HQ560_22655, partial [bacterium]|nr:hypothetical protein [bacterium]
VDSFCFEDWAQYHVHMMNDLFARSKWPSAPDGIIERVRIDKIVLGPSRDMRDYEKHRRRNGDLQDIIEYNGIWLFGKSDPIEQAQKWALSVDWGLPHELAHQLGLVDIYQLNVDPWQILVRRQDDAYVTFKYFFPNPKTMMHWHGPHNFSEQCANYLNRTHGRPRGYYGDYLYDLPEQVSLKVVDADGSPVPGAAVDVFQRRAFKDPRHVIANEPIATGRTDERGGFPLPNRPAPSHTTLGRGGYTLKANPFGHVHIVGQNGTLLARVRREGREEFHFLTIFDLNVAKARGHVKEYVHTLRTRFPSQGAPKPPTGLRLEYHLPKERGAVSLHWAAHAGARTNVYMKVGDGGDTIKPFTLVRVVERGTAAHDLEYFEKFAENGLYSPDTFLAVTTVDAKGRESGLSEVVGIPRINEARKATVLPDGRVVFTSGRRSALWHSAASGGIAGFGIRPLYYDVDPWGICSTADGGLVVADGHHNQVLVFDGMGDMVRRISDQPPIREKKSAEPGKFDWPCDVAVDGAGNLYVLEREGKRVQSFDKAGTLRYAFDGGETPWKRPSALSVCGDRLLVSDEGSGRVIIYRLEAKGVVFEREVTGLRWPDRALLTSRGNVVVCDVGDNAVKVIAPDGKVLRRHESLELAFQPGSVKLDGPRGLCTRDGKTAYLVTRFPIRTCKVRLE